MIGRLNFLNRTSISQPGVQSQASSSSAVPSSSLQPNLISVEDPKPYEVFSKADQSGVKMVGDFLKGYLEGFKKEEFKQDMQAHLQKLRLMDSQGEFVIESLKNRADQIIPSNFTKAECEKFIDASIEANSSNSYLQAFIQAAKADGNFPQLWARLQDEGGKTIPNVLAYAVVLNGLTKAMLEDPAVIEDLSKVWDGHREKINLFKYVGWFEVAKVFSVRFPMNNIIRTHKEGKPPRGFLQWMLPLNILEATFSDFTRGFFGNAKAGWVLAVNNPKMIKTGSDYNTAKLSEGKIGLNLPFPKEWADLYQSWNADFVGKFDDMFPYMLPKLLVPAVADYKDKPENYIYQRALALYIHIYFFLFDRVEKVDSGAKVSGWSDKNLMNIWGWMNRKASEHYQSLAKHTAP